MWWMVTTSLLIDMSSFEAQRIDDSISSLNRPGAPPEVMEGWRQTGRQTGRQAGRQADRQTDRQTDLTDQADLTDRQTDRQTDRHMDRQTGQRLIHGRVLSRGVIFNLILIQFQHKSTFSTSLLVMLIGPRSCPSPLLAPGRGIKIR